MRLQRSQQLLWLLPLLLAGCSSTMGSRLGGTQPSQSKSIAVVGENPLPSSTGEPGGKVGADSEDPEPRRNPDTRISGRVVDEAGDPVPGATVRLADRGEKGGKEILGRTDRSGAFTLNGLRPGSSYVLIAEGEDDHGPILGRVQASTADTSVKIALISEEKKPTTRRVAKPIKARPISNREDVETAPEIEEAPRVNREDVGSPTEEAEPIDSGPPESGRVGRPQLAPPDPGVGWKNSRNASASRPRDRDAVDDSSSPDKPVKRQRPVKPQPPSGPEAPDNPLPPALDPEDDPAPAKPTSARSNLTSKVEARAIAKPRESGEIKRVPEASLDDKADRARSLSRDEADPSTVAFHPAISSLMPDPDPVLMMPPSAAELTANGPTEPPPMPLVGAEVARVVATDLPHPTTSPPGPPSADHVAPPSIPAPQPVFSSNDLAAKPVEKLASPADYNPFANLAPVTSPMVKIVENTPIVPQAPDLGQPAPAADLPRKKWGELATVERPVEAATPPRTSLAGSLLRRIRPTAAIKDPAIASCSYDPRLRKINDFRLPDLEGKPVRFQELDADYVLLDFWGTWCEPCLDAIPHLIALQKKYGPGKLKVVGIACEEAATEQRKAKVDEVSRRLGINYPILLSTMDGKPCPIQQALQIQAMPTMVLVDRKGEVLWRNSGSTSASESRLDKLLALKLSQNDPSRR